MLSHQFLEYDDPVLKSGDDIAQALDLFEEMDSQVLPVIEPTTRKLIGLLKIGEIEHINDKAIKLCQLDLKEPVKVYSRQHLFEAIRLMLLHEIRLLPVVDNDMTYLGLLRKARLLEVLSDMLNLAEYGSVITIDIKQRDYTLSEIVQVIEAEGAKILGIAVETPSPDKNSFSVSIKLNIEEVSRVASALRRYGYNISSETISETFHVDFEARADELLNYLDM